MGRCLRNMTVPLLAILLCFACAIHGFALANGNMVVSSEPVAGSDLITSDGVKVTVQLEHAVAHDADSPGFDESGNNCGSYTTGSLQVASTNMVLYRVKVTNYGSVAVSGGTIMCRLPSVTSMDGFDDVSYSSVPLYGLYVEDGTIVDPRTVMYSGVNLEPGQSVMHDIQAILVDDESELYTYQGSIDALSFAEFHCNESEAIAVSNTLPLNIIGDDYPTVINDDLTLSAVQAVDKDTVVYTNGVVKYDANNTQLLYQVTLRNDTGYTFNYRSISCELFGSNDIIAKDTYAPCENVRGVYAYVLDEAVDLPSGESRTYEFRVPVTRNAEGEWPDDVRVKFYVNGSLYDSDIEIANVFTEPVSLTANYNNSISYVRKVNGRVVDDSVVVLHKGDIVTYEGSFVGPVNDVVVYSKHDVPPGLECQFTAMNVLGASYGIAGSNLQSVSVDTNSRSYTFNVSYKVTSAESIASTCEFFDMAFGWGTTADLGAGRSTSGDRYVASAVEPTITVRQAKSGNVASVDDLSVSGGDVIDFEVEVSNMDVYDMDGVRAVLFAVPQSMTVDVESISDGGELKTSGSSSFVSWSIDKLPADYRHTFTLSADAGYVSSSLTYVSSGVLSIYTATSMLENAYTSNSVKTTVLLPPADVKIEYVHQFDATDYTKEDVSVTQSDLASGSMLYSIILTNEGRGPAQNVQVQASMPGRLVTNIDGTNVNAYSATIDEIAVGETKALTFTAQEPYLGATAVGTWTHEAVCAWTGASEQVNSNKLNLVVEPDVPDLTITGTVLVNGSIMPETYRLQVGDTVTYRYTVHNNGVTDVTDLVMALGLTADGSFEYELVPTGASQSGNSFSWSHAILAPSNSVDCDVSLTVTKNLTTATDLVRMAGNVIANGMTQTALPTLDVHMEEYVAPPITPHLNVVGEQSVNGGAYTQNAVTVQPHDMISYRFSITNDCGADLENISFSDQLPSGLLIEENGELVELDKKTAWWSVIRDGETLVHEFSVLVPSISHDEQWSNSASVMAGGSSTFTSNSLVARASYMAPGADTIDVSVQQSTTSSDGPFTSDVVSVEPGDMIYYKIMLSNMGNMDANNVVVTDVIPSGLLKYDSMDGTWKPGAIWTGRKTTLAGGKDASWVVECKVPDVSVSTTWTNNVTVDWDGAPSGGKVSSDVRAAYTVVPVVSQASVHIEALQAMKNGTGSKSALSVKSGDTVTFTYRVWNDGSEPAENVRVNAMLNSSLPLNGAKSWTIDSLDVGEERTFTVDAVVPNVIFAVTWTSYGTVDWDNHDSSVTSNFLKLSVVHEEPPVHVDYDVTVDCYQMLGKVRPSANVFGWTKDDLTVNHDTEAGTKLYHKFVISNNSDTYAVRDLVLQNTYPSVYQLMNNIVTEDIDVINPGEVCTVIFEVPVSMRQVGDTYVTGRYATEGLLRCDNETICTFEKLYVNFVDNSSVVTPTPVVPTPTPQPTPTPVPDVEYTFEQSGDGVHFTTSMLSVEEGDEVTYRATIRNTGSGHASNVHAYVRLPDGLAVVGSGMSEAAWPRLDADSAFELEFKVRVPSSEHSRDWSSCLVLNYDGLPSVVESDYLTLKQIVQAVVPTPTPTPTVTPIPTPEPTPVPEPELSIIMSQSSDGVDFDTSDLTLDPGSVVVYKITVFNTGDGPATDVVLVDTLPVGLSSSDVNEYRWPVIQAGEQKDVYITVIVSDVTESKTWMNKASLTWAQDVNGIESNAVALRVDVSGHETPLPTPTPSLGPPTPSTEPMETPVVPTPTPNIPVAGQVEVTQYVAVTNDGRPDNNSSEWSLGSVTLDYPLMGYSAYYQYVIENIGDDVLSGVTLQTVLPDGFEFTSGNNGLFGPYDIQPHSRVRIYVTLPLDTFAHGVYGLQGTVEQEGTVLWTGMSPVLNVVLVVPSTPTPVVTPTMGPAIPTDEPGTSPEPSVGPENAILDVQAYQSVNDEEMVSESLVVHEGDKVTYTFVVTNHGDVDAENVELSARVPDGVTLLGQRSTMISWTWDVIGPGESRTAEFDVLIPELEVGLLLKSNALVSYDGYTSMVSSNEVETRCETDVSVNEALELTLLQNVNSPYTSNSLTVNGGEQVYYRMVVKNVSDDVVTDIELENVLPSGFSVSRNLTWTIDSLDPGEEEIIDFNATVSQFDGRYSGYAVVKWAGGPDDGFISNSVTIEVRTWDDPTETVEPTVTPDVTVEPSETDEPQATDAPTLEPVETDRPVWPTDEPTETDKPVEPNETSKPMETDRPTWPDNSPEPTEPVGTQLPDQTSRPIETQRPDDNGSNRPIDNGGSSGDGSRPLDGMIGGGSDGQSGSGGNVNNDSLANPNKNNPDTGVDSSIPLYVGVIIGLVALAGIVGIGYLVVRKKKMSDD